MKIQYTGVFFNATGYGRVARDLAASLILNGADVSINPVSYETTENLDYGIAGELCKKNLRKFNDPDINIIHITPQDYSRFKVGGAINIGGVFWESDKMPEPWIQYCNDMDAMIYHCDWTKEVFEKKVTVPGYKIHCAINKEERPDLPSSKSIIQGIKDDDYVFYSIFQWTERKNPIGLLKAYFSEFTREDNVVLLLKTYRCDDSASEKQIIKNDINQLKIDMNLKEYPRILLIGDRIDKEQIDVLHENCDCFVLLHRAEGWGLPLIEAMLHDRPTISTDFGGQKEFMHPDNSYLIPFQLTPTAHMPWIHWYNSKQWWAEPDLLSATKVMRELYERRERVKENSQYIQDNFGYEKIGKDFLKVLGEIYNK